MNPEGYQPRRIRPDEWGAAVALVKGCGLPVADLAPGRQQFWGAFDGDRLVGVIGAEPFGDSTLVRSMAVAEEARGRGLATALYRALEDSLRGEGRGHLVLFTETAQGFFADRGFVVVPREDVPDSVKASAEFQGLCPVSAVAMVKPLS